MDDMPQVRVSHDGKQFAILVEPGSDEPWYLIEAYPGCCSKRGVGTDEQVADWTPLVSAVDLAKQWEAHAEALDVGDLADIRQAVFPEKIRKRLGRKERRLRDLLDKLPRVRALWSPTYGDEPESQAVGVRWCAGALREKQEARQ